jgi:hypothetical protein
MQQVLGVGRRLAVLATLEYTVLAFEIAFYLVYNRSYCYLSAAMLDLIVVNKASRALHALHFFASAVPDSMIITFEVFISSQI